MNAYSLDLRERVCRAVDAGLPYRLVGQRFDVGTATIKRWVRRRRDTGSLAPKPRPGRAPRIGPPAQPALAAQLGAAPDATLAQHCATWAQTQGMHVSVATMARAITRLGWTVKKNC